MPTNFKESQGNILDPIDHTVKESVEEVTDSVNTALSANLKYVTFTTDGGKQFSVEAQAVYDIKEA